MNIQEFQAIMLDDVGVHPKTRIVAGVSGGPDSVALLSLLKECELDLVIFPVYVDHCLRPHETPREIELVEQLSQHYGLEPEVICVDSRKYQQENRTSPEESARLLRYEALQGCLRRRGADVIAVAHTADDQAEEILLRLIRGTGLKGLSGMKMSSGNIIRPLLRTSKQELLTYLDHSGLSYCLDSSNTDCSFLRNRVRLDLLPALAQKFNPSIRSTLLQTAEILQEEESLLEKIAADRLQACFTRHDSAPGTIAKAEIDLRIFSAEHKAIQRRIIEKICWQFSSRPSFPLIKKAIELATAGKTGAEIHLPAGLRLIKSGPDTLTCVRPQERAGFRGSLTPPDISALQLETDKSYELEGIGRKITLKVLHSFPQASTEANVLLLDNSKLTWPLTLRSARAGERFSPQGMSGRKKVAKYLADLKIPKHDRHLYPVLVTRNEIIAVAGLRSDGYFAADDNAKEIVAVYWAPLGDE